ncbi:septum site-determining protein MinC [Caenimonas aquaedulcis]|uniref:Probable septum site-determining protein MinC n=1 Tax=Caenimonas aquaedulcis TaxID=2793270 RepID=A0A931H5U9_9BURK|nr:septum site-determining protein MinC [Caenimonas aquaedulcis]MBG9389022.1 septum site-determining protein MinC [Caenimonas aquaedulcis]
MTVALAGRAPATFEIKSANLPLVSLLLKSHDLAALATELAARFGDIPDFFEQDPLVVDLAPLGGKGDVDFAELVKLLKGYRVMPVAVKGGSEGQMRDAAAQGLAVANDVVMLATPDALTPALSQGEREQDKVPDAPPVALSALVIDKPLRSGQQVYARGRDVVVLSMVNAGAEIIADGHIHVYAPLRGKAIAGARGNTEARIFSTCLEPELISIAGVYRTSEVPLPESVRSRPTQVRLDGGSDGKLVMTPL